MVQRKAKRLNSSSMIDQTPNEMEGDREEQVPPQEIRQRLVRELSMPKCKDAQRKLQRALSNTSGFQAMPVVGDEHYKSLNIMPNTMFPLLYFKEPLAIDEVRRVLKERLWTPFERFRSRLLRLDPGKAGPKVSDIRFEVLSDLDADMEYHVTSVSDVTTEEELGTFIAAHWAEEWDTTKPLWKFWYFDHLSDGRHLLLGSVDHSICDGHTMVEVLFSMLDEMPLAEARAPPRREPPPVPLLTRLSALSFGYLSMFLQPLFPDVPSDVMARRLPGKESDLSAERSLCVPAALDLARVKEIKSHYPGATVNDVVVTVMTLAIKRHLEEKCDPRTTRVSAMFPINLRPGKSIVEGDGGSFGNKFAMGRYTFDFGFSSRRECMWRVRHHSEWLKWNPQPYVELKMQSLFALMNMERMARTMSSVIPTMPSMLITNVPGPQVRVRFLGQEIDTLFFHVISNLFGALFAVFSYNGQVQAALNTDPRVAKAGDIAKHWKPEFDALYEEVVREGGGPGPEPPRRAPAGLLLVGLSCSCLLCAGLLRRWGVL